MLSLAIAMIHKSQHVAQILAECFFCVCYQSWMAASSGKKLLLYICIYYLNVHSDVSHVMLMYKSKPWCT